MLCAIGQCLSHHPQFKLMAAQGTHYAHPAYAEADQLLLERIVAHNVHYTRTRGDHWGLAP